MRIWDRYVDGPNDYSLWLATVASGTPSISTLTGKAVEWIDGDFNGDGIVDGPNDYSLWAETVGMTALGFNAS